METVIPSLQSSITPFSRIRAVTFDVGGTLIEPWPSVGHVYAEVAAGFGVRGVEPEQLTANFVRAWKACAQFDYRRESWFALVRETFAPLELPPEFFPAVYDRFAEPDVWRIYEDVLPALTGLRERGIKLGLISNWDERLRPLLSRLGLEDFFSSRIISCEAGATKPDARLFLQAAAELAVAPEEMLHVGDSEACDVAGARAAGARACHLVRHRPLPGAGQIASLAELHAGISGL